MDLNWHDIPTPVVIALIFLVFLLFFWIGRRRARRDKELSKILRRPTDHGA